MSAPATFASGIVEPTAPPDTPVLLGPPGDREITDAVLAPLWRAPPPWWLLFGVTGLGALGFAALVAYTVAEGIGVWGNNIPVAWAFGIINFVWWIGLGHAGTFISAFLLLLEQKWRGSINRIAEAMTLFAVTMAGIFPILHLGRPWFAYWLVPYPSTMGVWPQFKSALPWDAAAIFTYLTVSLLFWYTGLVPDLAAARDRAPTVRRARVYGVLALGWKGRASDWSRYRVVYGLLAGMATPLVISVHSIVSLDFAIADVPGWHQTFYPPYFVVGALYSGFALVLMLIAPIRRIFGWEAFITERHLDANAKILLAMGWIMIYAYAIEAFIGWYSGDAFERFLVLFKRPSGTYAWAYWGVLLLNGLPVQLLWSRRFRRSGRACFLVGACVFAGMWLERFMIVVGSLERDFLPSAFSVYHPTWVDLGILGGSLCTFAFLFLLFLKLVPAVAIHELKDLARSGAPRPVEVAR